MRSLISFTAFIGGFITLSLEILGFRVLAPHFGYSIYVFGSLIGLILFALALGYWLGGALSRRGTARKRFFLFVLIAGVYLVGTSATYGQLLEALEKLGIIPGTLLTTFILWAFPMAAFAAISPYLIGLRTAEAKDQAGHSAGWISAVGTMGGLAGTFLTSFYLLPVFGTHATFAANAYAAVAVPLLWLLFSDARWLLVAIVVPIIGALLPGVSLPAGVVHAEESPYSRLEVVDYGKSIGLRTDTRSRTAYSVVMKDGSLPPFVLYDLFAVPAAANGAKEALLLGLGAGTLPTVHKILNPELRIAGVEIDPQVVDIGKQFFGLKDMNNLESITIADARPFLEKQAGTYDAIEMDIFRETEIPFYLASREFFELTKAHLNAGGVFMMNIYDPSSDHRIERRIAATAAAVYPDTYVVPAGLGSFFLVGTTAPIAIPDKSSFADVRLGELADYFTKNAVKISPDSQAAMFTDDLAPIETLYQLK